MSPKRLKRLRLRAWKVLSLNLHLVNIWHMLSVRWIRVPLILFLILFLSSPRKLRLNISRVGGVDFVCFYTKIRSRLGILALSRPDSLP